LPIEVDARPSTGHLLLGTLPMKVDARPITGHRCIQVVILGGTNKAITKPCVPRVKM